MAWREFWSARMLSECRTGVFRKDKFDSNPQGCIRTLLRSGQRRFQGWPFGFLRADVAGMAPDAAVTVYLQAPYLHLGGFQPGEQQFRAYFLEYATVTPPGPPRGCFDHLGMKHLSVTDFRFNDFKYHVPGNGILRWDLAPLGGVIWPPAVHPVGINGHMFWLSQVWVWE
jgi:hypothetical protein